MPADDQDAGVDVDALTDRLKELVAERRRSGEYPPGLESELDDHFRRITARAADMGDMQRLLEEVRLAAEMGRHRIEYTSGVPGGTQIHRTIGRAVSRQTEGALNQVTDFARAVLVLLQAIVESHPVHETVLPDINARLDGVLERLAAYDRAPGGDSDSRALAARVERLEQALLDVKPTPAYSPRALERTLGGSREEVVQRYRPLAEPFLGLSPVLDLGSGGGEMLEVLGGAGVEAHGVDIDPEAVEETLAAGHAATRADAVEYLGSMAGASLGGVFAAHLLEQLTPLDATELLSLASRKLRPGGRLVVLGYNPASVYLQASSWYSNPRNLRPVPAELVELLLRQWGFAEVTVEPFGATTRGLEAVPLAQAIVATR